MSRHPSAVLAAQSDGILRKPQSPANVIPIVVYIASQHGRLKIMATAELA
jgi:hypothetical protein